MNLKTIYRLALLSASLGLSSCASFSSVESAPLEPVAESPIGSVQRANSEPISTGTYLLGEGDEIAIQVFDEPDLTMDAQIGASGIINYSYLGDVTVSGKTAVELEQHVTELLRNGYLVNPSVNVTIKQYRPFFIGGEVRSPGSYPYQPGLTLTKAITLAGGLTDRASSRRIFIVKPSGDEFRASLNQDVAPGDTISIREGFF